MSSLSSVSNSDFVSGALPSLERKEPGASSAAAAPLHHFVEAAVAAENAFPRKLRQFVHPGRVFAPEGGCEIYLPEKLPTVEEVDRAIQMVEQFVARFKVPPRRELTFNILGIFSEGGTTPERREIIIKKLSILWKNLF